MLGEMNAGVFGRCSQGVLCGRLTTIAAPCLAHSTGADLGEICRRKLLGNIGLRIVSAVLGPKGKRLSGLVDATSCLPGTYARIPSMKTVVSEAVLQAVLVT